MGPVIVSGEQGDEDESQMVWQVESWPQAWEASSTTHMVLRGFEFGRSDDLLIAD